MNSILDAALAFFVANVTPATVGAVLGWAATRYTVLKGWYLANKPAIVAGVAKVEAAAQAKK